MKILQNILLSISILILKSSKQCTSSTATITGNTNNPATQRCFQIADPPSPGALNHKWYGLDGSKLFSFNEGLGYYCVQNNLNYTIEHNGSPIPMPKWLYMQAYGFNIDSPPNTRNSYYGEYKIIIKGSMPNGQTSSTYVWFRLGTSTSRCSVSTNNNRAPAWPGSGTLNNINVT